MQLVDQGLVAEVNGKKLFDFTPAVSVGWKKENEFHISLKRINKKKKIKAEELFFTIALHWK